MSIIEKLDELGEVVSDLYPNINNGGCCVFAAMVVNELQKQGIKASGIVIDSGARSSIHIDEVRPLIKTNTVNEWQNNGVFFWHVAVEFTMGNKKHHYDTGGVKKATNAFGGIPVYKGRMKLEEMKSIAARQPGWNPAFRRKDIPAIRKLVKFYLKVDKAPIPAL